MSDKLKVGPYVVVQLLGHGGMGSVYRAHHETLGREVALKVLTLGAGDDDIRVARFRREAEAALKLNHPGVVKVYDYGTDGNRQYLAMEVVNGATLKEVLEQHGTLPVAEASHITVQLLEALGACHAMGLVHRDVKPANVMIEKSGRVRLLDLGLVKHLDRTILTAEGAVVGTPRYMPPEMLATGETDLRGDIYQVGTLLYECLAGKPVADAIGLMEVVEQVLDAPPPRIPAVLDQGPRGLREFLTRALAREPAERFESCAAALTCIRTSFNSGRIAATRTPASGLARMRTSAGIAPSTAAAATAAAAVAATPAAGLAPAPPARPLPPGVKLLVFGLTAAVLAVGLVVWLAVARRPVTVELESAGGGSRTPAVPRELKVETGPADLRVTWRTGRPVRGSVTIPAIGRTEREERAGTEHAVVIERLVPETRYALEVGDADGGPQLAHTAITRSVAGVVREITRLLDGADLGKQISQLRADLLNPFKDKNSRLSDSWRTRLNKKFGGDEFRQAAKDLRSIRHLIAEADVPVPARGRLLQRLSDLEDLHEIVEMGLKFDSGLRVRDLFPPGLVLEDRLPEGLKPMLAVRFGPAHPEVTLPVAPRVIEAGEPMVFNQDFYNLLTSEPARKTRKLYELGGPLSTSGRLERVYLGFRATQGLPIEKVQVAVIAQGTRNFVGRIVSTRGTPPPKRFIRLDERALADPGAALQLSFSNRDAVLTGTGVRIYSLVLYGEHP